MTKLHAFTIALLLAPLAEAAPRRDAVERLLGGYEARPLAAELKRLGPGADQTLIEIAVDEKASPLRRVRALAALAHVPTPAGRDLCRQVIRKSGQAEDGFELVALSACAETLGVFGAAELPDLLPLLAHPSAEIRLSAARGVAATGAANAVPPLRQRLGIESDPSVRAVLSGSLRALERR